MTVRNQLVAVLRAELEETDRFIPPGDAIQVLTRLGDESYPLRVVPRDSYKEGESEDLADSHGDERTESEKQGSNGA